MRQAIDKRRRAQLLRRGDHGAALVEAAIVMPLLCLLVFGIIEFGMLYKDTSTVSAAVSSGARTASTQSRQVGYETNTAAAVAATIKSANVTPELLMIYKTTSTGTTHPSPATCTNCYVFTWKADTRSWAPVLGKTWPALQQYACGKVADTDFVGVYVEAKHQMYTGMFGGTRTIAETTTMRLEPTPSPCRP